MFKKILISWIVGLLFFTGCTFRRPIPKNLTHNQTWISDSEYYGKGMKFELVESDFFDKSKQVFWINNEEELALLLAIKFDKGVRVVEYISEVSLDADKVISYLISLFVHDFEYYDGSFNYSKNGLGRLVSKYVQLESIDKDIAYVEKEIDDWTRAVKQKNFDELNEVRYLHDLIITQVRYDETAANSDNRETDAFAAKGVFEDKLAVCNGYSQAFMGLLKEMGIPAILISSDTDDHAWNMVYVQNEWQFVDTTWDDLDTKIEKPIYDYFLKDSNEFVDHEFDKSGYMTLSKEDYQAFANYVFPQTAASR